MMIANKKPPTTTSAAEPEISVWRKGVLSMKPLRTLCLVLVAPGLMWAQASAPKAESSSNDTELAAELKALREALSQTQNQMASQQKEIEALRQQLGATQPAAASTQGGAPQMINAALTTPTPQPASSYSGASAGQQQAPGGIQQANEGTPTFRIGSADIRLGGFIDAENIYRTTNTQNNIATNYAAIPFSNTPQGNLSEYRLTAQFSRFNIRVTDKIGDTDVAGYCEADFSGNDATNAYQTVNGHTLRMRLCFMRLQRSKWEILGGQTWSWLTPNRVGIGPNPAELAITYNEDQNIGVGLPYTRAAEVRVAYHFNDHLAFGVDIEDPDQYIGTFVALPSAYASTVGPQFDNGSQIGTPNLFPDILSKITYDTRLRGRHFHLEAVGLLTSAREAVIPKGGTTFASHSAVGGGGSVATNFELFKNFLFLGNAFWSDGGGRYLVADGPQLVIRPDAVGTNVFPSLVHAGAGSVGFEWIANQQSAFAVYYA